MAIAALIVAGLAVPAIAHCDTWSLSVPGTANIYGAGHLVPPGPDGNGGGTLPPGVALPAGTDRILRVVGATGFISYAPTVSPNGPDGLVVTWYFAFDWGGIAGCQVHSIRQVNGIFLDDSEPMDPPPAELVADSMAFRSLSPLLRQTFPIGDGLTGTAVGDTQTFVVPPGATRLFLGFIDSYTGTQPGWYGDNSGSLAMQISVVAGPPLTVNPPTGTAAFALGPVAPNPTHGLASVRYAVARRSHVRLTLLDIQGREVWRMMDGDRDAGRHSAPLDVRDMRPGLYFVRLQAPGTDMRVRVAVFR